MKAKYIIGIDPDVDKSGVCFLNTATKQIGLHSLSFPMLIDYLRSTLELQPEGVRVVVEAGWLNEKSCFHSARGKGAERIAKNVGANHQVGKLIIAMCKHYGIESTEQIPLVKRWRGRDGKITHQEISSFIPMFPKVSNQETRDAALIAWIHAGLPVKINTK